MIKVQRTTPRGTPPMPVRRSTKARSPALWRPSKKARERALSRAAEKALAAHRATYAS